MPPIFRYRFVDFGTVFAGSDGIRAEDQGAANPATLFRNELVTDVGGSCCSDHEQLVIFDHHFTRKAQFPAASAAVLHKAKLIHERFSSQDGVFWLVTHKQPDFDAFCSMYLARWILEAPNATLDWRDFGLAPDAWEDLGARQKINWFDPNLQGASAELRWPLLMASYAAIVDNSRQFPCPRNRALHSIFYAALKRGRDYLSETSGAQEFFDEVRKAMRDRNCNPIYDSVLEDSIEFAPELAMLDRESDAYRRDVRRARKSIVYLQQCRESLAGCFEELKQRPLFASADATPAVDREHFLAQQPRVATDGIYLRDPECLLFKEWARLDLENSSLGKGFEFTAVAYSNGRPEGDPNQTDYFFAIDPERANGRHLYAVWAQLQSQEVLAMLRRATPKAAGPPRHGFEGRAGTMAGLFGDPWFDGQNYRYTIVATPNHGTLIARQPGMDAGLRDDAVTELVRSELEHSIYEAAPNTTSPQVRVLDLSPTTGEADIGPRDCDISRIDEIEAPAGRRFRFARIRLREDVPITTPGAHRGLTLQIGETLWQVLYPDLQGATPPDFADRHLVVAPRCVGVWGDRGIAIAYKSVPGAEQQDDDGGTQQDFVDIVTLARRIDELIAAGEKLAHSPPAISSLSPATHGNLDAGGNTAETVAAEGEDLARKAAQIKHNLALPHSELLRRFYEATGIDELLSTLRDLNQTAAEHVRRAKMEEQAQRLAENTETVAEVQSKVEWLEIFIIGVYAADVIDIFTRHEGRERFWWETALLLFGFAAFMLLATFALRPWEKKRAEEPASIPRPGLILIVVFGVVGLALAWILGTQLVHWLATH